MDIFDLFLGILAAIGAIVLLLVIVGHMVIQFSDPSESIGLEGLFWAAGLTGVAILGFYANNNLGSPLSRFDWHVLLLWQSMDRLLPFMFMSFWMCGVFWICAFFSVAKTYPAKRTKVLPFCSILSSLIVFWFVITSMAYAVEHHESVIEVIVIIISQGVALFVILFFEWMMIEVTTN